MKEFMEWAILNGVQLSVIYSIYAVSTSFSFLLFCVGVSYLRTTQYYRYDSKDEENEDNEE